MWAGDWKRTRVNRMDERATEMQNKNNCLGSQATLLREILVLNTSSTSNAGFLQVSEYLMSFK